MSDDTDPEMVRRRAVNRKREAAAAAPHQSSQDWSMSGRAVRQVGEIFDRAIVDVDGVPTKREYVSRYDEGGNFVSQGYEHYGPASPNETSAKTWKHR